MFDRHVMSRLTAYHHGETSAGERRQIEAHLLPCSKCRKAGDDVRFAMRLASSLSVTRPPDSAWDDLQRIPDAPQRRAWRFASPPGPAWEVSGLPGKALLRPGEVLETLAHHRVFCRKMELRTRTQSKHSP